MASSATTEKESKMNILQNTQTPNIMTMVQILLREWASGDQQTREIVEMEIDTKMNEEFGDIEINSIESDEMTTDMIWTSYQTGEKFLMNVAVVTASCKIRLIDRC